jgi:hypothetical protein
LQEHLHGPTTYTLISSHGRIDELLYYAMLIEDYERVISYYIQNGTSVSFYYLKTFVIND